MAGTGAVVIKRRLEWNVGQDALGNLTQNEWLVLENDIVTGPNEDISHFRLQAPLPVPQEAFQLGKSLSLATERG